MKVTFKQLGISANRAHQPPRDDYKQYARLSSVTRPGRAVQLSNSFNNLQTAASDDNLVHGNCKTVRLRPTTFRRQLKHICSNVTLTLRMFTRDRTISLTELHYIWRGRVLSIVFDRLIIDWLLSNQRPTCNHDLATYTHHSSLHYTHHSSTTVYACSLLSHTHTQHYDWEWTLAMTFSGHDDSTINIVLGLLLLLLLLQTVTTAHNTTIVCLQYTASRCHVPFRVVCTLLDFFQVTFQPHYPTPCLNTPHTQQTSRLLAACRFSVKLHLYTRASISC